MALNGGEISTVSVICAVGLLHFNLCSKSNEAGFKMFNISHSVQSLKSLALLAGSSLLIACGSGGAGDSASTDGASPLPEVATIEGSAIKGVISNGLVNIYQVQNNGGVMEASAQALTAPVRTDANGTFSFTLDTELTNEIVVIEVTADGQTRMTCDVTSGCGTDGSGSPILFGDQFALSSDFSMLGVVTGVSNGQRVSAQLNPMTHMAVAYANASVQGLSASSIQAAMSAVEEMLDLDAGALAQSAADISALDLTATPSKTELELGIVSASFLNLVNTPDWDGIEEILVHIEERMGNSGQLASVNMGALRDVTLDDLFDGATTIADDLIAAAPQSEYAQTLTLVSEETAAAYNEVAQGGSQVDPVTIVSQPQSTTLDEGESVVFSVGANGGGTLSFQWRKDGVAIAGATNSSYAVSLADLNDAGVYDVIVSNSVGSVASTGALLAVNEVVSLGSIALNWDIPTQREDGTELELYEIDGYVIAYGTNAGDLSNQLNIVGGNETSATLDELPPATYYFAIATIDSDGRQGNYSTVISQTVM